MSLDLLASLQAEAGYKGEGEGEGGDQPGSTNGAHDEGVSVTDKELAEHMAVYDSIKQQLEAIERNTDTIKDITKKLKTTANESVRKQIISEKDDAIQSTTQNGLRVKKLLDGVKKENEAIIAQEPEQRNTARMDMRINLYNTYLRKFDHVITESNTAIVQFKSVLEGIEKRQIKVVLPDMNDEQVQEIIDSGKSAEVVQQALVSDNLQDTVRMIEERHDEILKLERQVREIFELFNELATLVDLQQESLDVISVNIHNTVTKVVATEDVLLSAREYQKKARNRKLCCCLILLCIIAAVVLIPTLISTVGNYA